MSYVLVALGLGVLTVGGDLLVRGATGISAWLRISPMVVGLTVVAIGSSLPELAVGIDAALRGYPGIVTGNIVGTNIVNLLLILGISAAMRPILTQRQMLRMDLPMVAAVAVLLFLLSLSGSLSWPVGVVLLVLGAVYTVVMIIYARRADAKTAAVRARAAERHHSAPTAPLRMSPGRVVLNVVFLISGLALVILGATWLVSGAVDIATSLGVSDVLIGLTIVAIGTSAPELVTSIIATIKGQASMAIGNLIGSSIYNIVFILGVTVVVAPSAIPVPAEVLYVDMVIMAAVSLLVVLMFRTGRRVSRTEGVVLAALYLVYLAYLILART